jgi:arsenate reductase-like glutaredoxin family protein
MDEKNYAYQDFSDKKLSQEELRKLLSQCVVPKKHILKDLVPLEKNANIMPKEKFDRLVENIKRDGRLTQYPFVMRLPNGRYGIPSGNHRVKAAIAAGIVEDWCVTCEVTLPREDALRIQISHNAIHGDQQNVVLLELANQFNNTELLRLSGAEFDLSKLNQDKLDFLSIDSGSLRFNEVLFYFSDYEIKKLDELLKDLEKKTAGVDLIYIAEKTRYDKFINSITKAKKELNIKSTSTVLNLFIDFVASHIEMFVEERKPKEKANEIV